MANFPNGVESTKKSPSYIVGTRAIIKNMALSSNKLGHYLYWLAIVNVLIQVTIYLAIPNIVARATIKKNKEKINEIIDNEATSEEMNHVIQEEIKITDTDSQEVPKWIYAVGFLSVTFSSDGLFEVHNSYSIL